MSGPGVAGNVVEAAEAAVIGTVHRWLERFVLGLNLCPFAPRDLQGPRLRCVLSRARDEAELLQDLRNELAVMMAEPALESTLLVHPRVLQDFLAYNDFLGVCDDALDEEGLVGVVQIASFHPDYEFGDAPADDPANYSNRSPYPMLHLLREDRVALAVAAYPDVAEVPRRNIDRLRGLGADRLAELRRSCFDE